MKEQMGNVSRKIESLRKNQKSNVRDQNHHHRNEKSLDKKISTLNMAEERILTLSTSQQKPPKLESQENNDWG